MSPANERVTQPYESSASVVRDCAITVAREQSGGINARGEESVSETKQDCQTMGGNALKNVVTRRYARDEYYALKDRILRRVRDHIPQCDVPKEFPGKESFGDLDVLMVYSSTVSIRDLIEQLFHPTEIVDNGDVYSFDVEQFQVDFILIPSEQFHHALVYFSYSDLGGLIGNVCHKIGLKYGIQGLWMNVHTKEFDPTTTSTKLLLSADVKEIFDFLGYDHERYLQGFETDKEFFHWIVQGKYFRRLYFESDQLNHAHRQRTSKRPIYIKFIAYLDEQQIRDDSAQGSTEHDRAQLSVAVRHEALIYFHKQEEFERGLNVRDQRRELKEKYNGRFFCDIDKAKTSIGVHMKNFERRFAPTDDEFQQWVIRTDPEVIKAEIETYKGELRQAMASKKTER